MNNKIIFLIDTLEVGGAEKSLLNICVRFKKFKPLFIQLYPGETLLPKFSEANISVIQLNLVPNYQFSYQAKKVLGVLEDEKVGLIHSTLFRSDQVARIVSSKLKVPLINSLVNNSYAKIRYNSMSLMQKLKLKYIEWIDRKTSHKVDLFISNSEAIKVTNCNALNVESKKVKVIYRGRSLDDFSGDFNLISLKENLGVSNQKIFLNVSRLLDRKGQLDLIRAFAKAKIDDSILFIAGEGPFRKTLEREIKRLNINRHVRLLGNRKDVPVLLQLADYFVFPSHYEGLPGALIEAMMSKTPIIASDIPENLECVSPVNSLIYPVGNIHSLTNAMRESLNMVWQDKITKAYQFASENFDINKVAKAYEQTYDKLLENRDLKLE